MGQANQRGTYVERLVQAQERNAKLVTHLQATGNKKALAALHVVRRPQRLATMMVMAGMLYQQK